jgi:hypothetical protein
VQRRDHRAILNLIGELHLVQQKDNPRVLPLSGRAQRGAQDDEALGGEASVSKPLVRETRLSAR